MNVEKNGRRVCRSWQRVKHAAPFCWRLQQTSKRRSGEQRRSSLPLSEVIFNPVSSRTMAYWVRPIITLWLRYNELTLWSAVLIDIREKLLLNVYTDSLSLQKRNVLFKELNKSYLRTYEHRKGLQLMRFWLYIKDILKGLWLKWYFIFTIK